MAVEAQLCSEDMGFPLFGSEDRLMSSVLGVRNGVCFQGSSTQPTIGTHHLASQSHLHAPKSNQDPSVCWMDSSQLLASELERQRAEMDFYLQFQSERSRRVLHEETRQRAALLQRYESKLMSIVQRQDLGLATAREKCVELQNCLVWADNEAKAWQKRAVENEALVQDLEKRLNQVRECNELAAQDAESTCESSSSRGNRDSCDHHHHHQSKTKMMALACKNCHVESSCVLFWPCRHLCSCKSCEALLGFCPVCESVKEGSMEVFLV